MNSVTRFGWKTVCPATRLRVTGAIWTSLPGGWKNNTRPSLPALIKQLANRLNPQASKSQVIPRKPRRGKSFRCARLNVHCYKPRTPTYRLILHTCLQYKKPKPVRRGATSQVSNGCFAICSVREKLPSIQRCKLTRRNCRATCPRP